MAYINLTPGTFAPTVTVPTGTVPVYVTNTGRYIQIGNRVFVDVYLTGDGGAEGAGGTSFNVALPVTASADQPTGMFIVGSFTNGAAVQFCNGQIAGSATVIQLFVAMFTAMTGADQNDITRTIRLQFFYEV